MLNWAARYYPIIRVLKAHGLFERATLLEIGSGPIGIGRFRKVPFVGCDISFPVPAEWPMTPVTASAAQLPMPDNEFDVVVASDVLEHVPPHLRARVISECLRVARQLVIFGFPSGDIAWQSDRTLLETYRKTKVPAPNWLTEHMEAMFPGEELFADFGGWNISQVGNENIRFHSWLMRMEMSARFVRVSSAAMRVFPKIVETLLRMADRPPCYRQIFTLVPQIPGKQPSASSQHAATRPATQ
jgi:hypothetical protein